MFGNDTSSHLRQRRNGRIILILLVLIALILFFIGQSRQGALSSVKTDAQDKMSPVMTYLTMPVRGFESFLQQWSTRANTFEENKRLRAELARLRDIEARANSLAFKISRFETILSVDTASDIPDARIAARAVSETNGLFVRSVLINAGANKGIKVGNAVMTTDGLLGHVVRVGQNSSRVLRLEDLNSRISVMSVRSQARAILKGNNSPSPSLSFIAESADWDNGDEVVTSGDSGVLPAGLPVGKLSISDDGDMTVHLYVNRHYVDWVWIYPYNQMLPPERDPALGQDPDEDQGHEQLSHVNIANEN